MYIEEASEKKHQLSLSHYFELTCESILGELQQMIPCEHWFIAYKEQQQWSVLYIKPSDTIDISAHSSSLMLLSEGRQVHEPSGQEPSYLGVPLKANNSIFDGVLCGYKPQVSNVVLEEKASLVQLLANIISYQLETEFKLNHQKYKIQQLINLSHTDSLTQLLNHRAWSQLLMVEEARAKRYEQPATIFIIDLDKLKTVNDTQGHHAGDELIIKAANCLRDVCRESDLVARLGGDEFGLLAIECDEVGAKVLLQNIYDAFDNAMIDASAGYCVMTENLSILDTVNAADKKMYKHKNNKNRHSTRSIPIPPAELYR